MISSGIIFMFLHTACNSDILPETGSPEFSGVCFETEVLPLLISNCANTGCHNSKDREEGIDLSNYNGIARLVNTKSPTKSKLLSVLRAGEEDERMPPPPAEALSQSQMDLLLNWIEEGANYVVACYGTDCPRVSEVSFTQDIKPILSTFCQGCHSTSSQSGGYSFSSYNGVQQAVVDGSLLGSITSLSGFISMPYNSDPMPPCNIELIKQWVDEGALNN